MGWYPPPDLAVMLRTFLLARPDRVLFGTDATAFPGVPGGAEVTHIARSAVTRDALALALSGLVRDGITDLETAVALGRGVLADNARHLYGWEGTAGQRAGPTR
jgi:predicted TIM-barrel fold metal-dependent hydrolase